MTLEIVCKEKTFFTDLFVPIICKWLSYASGIYIYITDKLSEELELELSFLPKKNIVKYCFSPKQIELHNCHYTLMIVKNKSYHSP